MAGERTLKVTILGDSKDAEQAFSRLGKASDSVHNTIRNVGLALAGAFTVTAGVGLVKGFLAEAEESRKVGAQTEAVIKSTGGAAHVTAQQFGELATSISNKVGIDDEAIQSGENLLATFTNVQNRVGKGNDIFNQATSVMTDMSVALGQDMPTSAMQLGKALNDPIRGMTALRRVGVTFTKQQEDQIKKMQESGDVAGAQKIILAELSKEFGGSAAAQATAGQKLGVIWGNLQEQIGTALLPIFDKVATWLGRVLPGVVGTAMDAIDKVVALVKMFVYTLRTGFTEDEGTPIERFALVLRDTFLPIIQKVIGWVKSFFYTLTSGFSEQDTLTGPEKFAFFIRDQVIPIIEKIAGFLGDHLKPILLAVGGVVGGMLVAAFVAWAVAAAQAAIATIAAAAPVILVGAAIAALAAGIIYAYTHWNWFREAVQAVASFLKDVLLPALVDTYKAVAEQLGNAVGWVVTIWPQISETIGHVMNAVRDIVTVVLAVVQAVWHAVGDDVMNYVDRIFHVIAAVIDAVMGIIRGIITTVLALINGDWGKAWDGIKQIVQGVWDGIFAIVAGVIGQVKSILGAELSIIAAVWGAAWGSIKGLFEGIWHGIAAIFKGELNLVIGALNTFIRAWNAIQFKMPEIDTHIPGIGKVGGFTVGVPDVATIPTLHMGGVFHAPSGRREGLALLAEGERVSRAGRDGANIKIEATLHATFTGKPDREAELMVERRLAGFANTLARAVATA